MMKGIFTAVGTLIVVIFILYLTFICTRYLGRNMKLKGTSRYMKIIDSLPLGQDSSIAVVTIGEKFFLIGITSSQIAILSEVDEDNLTEPAVEENEMKVPDFKEWMERIGNRKK